MKLNETELYKILNDFTLEVEETIALVEEVAHMDLDDILSLESRISLSELENIVEDMDEAFRNAPNVYTSEDDLEHYIVLNDIHLPFHRRKTLEAIERCYGNKNYNLILLGDILDCYDISTFPKSYHVGIDKEVELFRSYMKRWSLMFKKIFVVSGNHESRLLTYLGKRLSPSVMELLSKDIISNILQGLNLKNVYYTPGETQNWFIQIDNVILAHPSGNISRAILSTAQKVNEFFTARNFIADIFVSAHTHKLGMALDSGKLIVESGCLCLPQDYAMDGKVSYTPEASGYCVFTSKKGKVGFNDVRLQFV